MSMKPSIEFIAQNLQEQEIYPKVTAMRDYIIDNFEAELVDVQSKHRGPNIVGEDVVKEIIIELGFGYIKDIMDTIDNFEFNILLDFISLLNLLKGSREGLELILSLLGMDTVVSEWWQQIPLKEPHTFDLTVLMDTTFIPDVEVTLQRIEVFVQNYVFPKLDVIDFTFIFESFLEKNINMAGFVKTKIFGTIRQRAA